MPSFVVRIETDGDQAELERQFVQYLTQIDQPFLHDYARPSWGDYEGPFVTAISISSPITGRVAEWREMGQFCSICHNLYDDNEGHPMCLACMLRLDVRRQT